MGGVVRAVLSVLTFLTLIRAIVCQLLLLLLLFVTDRATNTWNLSQIHKLNWILSLSLLLVSQCLKRFHF